MIGIVDYGMGNLLSVLNAFEFSGPDAVLCSSPEDLEDAERIVLPGVGAFGDCIRNLEKGGFIPALEKAAFDRRIPVLGICLGMQVMAEKGFEGEEHRGLGWIKGSVERMTPGDPGLKVPQVGWNNIRYSTDCPLFNGLPESADFYFVHSFSFRCADPSNVAATCDYGGEVTAAVIKDNIFATQFHPEKSQDYGLRIIENFLEWEPGRSC